MILQLTDSAISKAVRQAAEAEARRERKRRRSY